MYQFRDPVHGFIDVSEDELKSLIQHHSSALGTFINWPRHTWFIMEQNTLVLGTQLELCI